MDERITTFENIKVLISKLLNMCEKYSLTFRQEDFFCFSDIDKKRKYYKSEYYKFISIFNQEAMSLQSQFVKISSFLLEADRNMDYQQGEKLKCIFEKYLVFESKIYLYTSTVEKEISKKDFSVSSMFNAIKRFKLSIEDLSTCILQVYPVLL